MIISIFQSTEGGRQGSVSHFRQKVKLQIFNTLGELIATLVDETKSAGVHQLEWNAGNLASGVYLYRMNAESVGDAKQFNSVRKMILLK